MISVLLRPFANMFNLFLSSVCFVAVWNIFFVSARFF